MFMLLSACTGTAATNKNIRNSSNNLGDTEVLKNNNDANLKQDSTLKKEPIKITSVSKAQLNAILAKGPANILAQVQTDAYKINGRFAGFKIVSFRIDASEVLGIKPGDVVIKVNDLKIETPDQYFEVFEKLKKAAFIKFDILRDGKAKIIKTDITS